MARLPGDLDRQVCGQPLPAVKDLCVGFTEWQQPPVRAAFPAHFRVRAALVRPCPRPRAPLDDRYVFPDPADLRRLPGVLRDDHPGIHALLIEILLDPGRCGGHIADQETELSEVRPKHADGGDQVAAELLIARVDSLSQHGAAQVNSFEHLTDFGAHSRSRRGSSRQDLADLAGEDLLNLGRRRRAVRALATQPVYRLCDDIRQDAATDRGQHPHACYRRSAGDSSAHDDQWAERGRGQHREQSGSGNRTRLAPGTEKPLPCAVPHQRGFGVLLLRPRTSPSHAAHSRPISPCTYLGSAELEVFRDTPGANPQATDPRLAQKPKTP